MKDLRLYKMIIRFIKFCVSAIYLVIDRLRSRILRVIGKVPRGTCVVLYYHRVTSDERSRFAEQMDDLVRWAKPVPADLHVPLSRGEHHAAVTFDDGFSETIENVLPELTERKIPVTFFIPSGYLGRPADWGKLAASSRQKDVVIPAARLETLKDHELVSIGSHGVTHANLLTKDIKDGEVEIFKSKKDLENILKKEVSLFSFPHGVYDESHIEMARKSGYRRVFTILPRFAFAHPEEFVTGRVAVEPTDGRMEFRLKLLGGYRWLPRAFALKRKLRIVQPLRQEEGSYEQRIET